MKPLPLNGLIPAVHTPFHDDGSLNLDAVEKQAGHLARNGIRQVFVGGSTGESSSLTVDERLALAGRWATVVRGTGLQLIVHVGSNCLEDSRTLAANAQQLKAAAIAALSPSYFKPRALTDLVGCAAHVAAAAPETPFYFYDIPGLTGVSFPMPEFLEQARERIPSLVGLKFTNPDQMAFQLCLRADGGRWDVAWGTDEYLLSALALGARGAVGSSYNFAAPVYHRVISHFQTGHLAEARDEQFCSVQLIRLLARYGYMAAAKATMGFVGVDVGPTRLPLGALSAEQTKQLRNDLEQLGFFQWLQ